MATRTLNKLTDYQIKAAIKRHQTGEPRRKNADGSWAEDGFELLSDGGGLYLRTSSSGSAKWTFRFKSPEGRDREMGLGSYPDVLPKKARELAQAQRARMRDGNDPIEVRVAQRRAARALARIPTFGELADSYVTEQIEPKSTNDKHIYQWKQTLGSSYCASIRDKRVDKVTKEDVLAILRQPVTKKVLDDAPIVGPLWTVRHETASRLLDRIKRVLDYAIVKDLRTSENPARWTGFLEHELPRPSTLVRHQPAMPYAQVPSFVARLREREAISAKALEFLILTATRSSETRNATWQEIDLDTAVWTIPASRMKARTEHRVPLSPRVVEILKSLRPDDRPLKGLVFPSLRGGVPLSDMVFKALFERMGVTGVTAHGFRSSFRDWAGDETDAPGEVAEAALAHIVGTKVERAYRRSEAFLRRRTLMLDWASYCEGHAPAIEELAA